MEDPEAQRRRKRALWWVVIVALALVVVGGVGFAARKNSGSTAANKKKNEKKETNPPSPVELSQVRRGRISTYLRSTTTLEARNSAVLVARRQGQVMAILAEEGQWVEKGKPIARLDDREARLKVQRTELAADMAKRELERSKQLKQNGYLSDKELDDLEVRMRNAWVDLEQARLELSQMTLTAPFSGRVVERMVNLGETVTEGKECFRIADFSPILARLYFPERELSRVRVGQQATLTPDLDAGREFGGKVSLVNPIVDRANGTFKVTLEIQNANGTLRPGTFARVRLKTGDFPDAMLMPRRGVLTEDGEDYVYIARGDSVMRAPVKLGAVEGDTAQIVQGLSAGERVVTVGQGGLKPGAKIKPVTL